MQIILTRTGPQSFGVTFGRNSNGLVVTSVTQLGIAHLADLRVGDIILRVNNQSCYAIAVAAMETLMSSNTHIILEISRTPTNAVQTPQSVISNRSSVPSGSQVIELDSEDESDEEDDDDEGTIRLGYNDYDSDDFSDDEDDEDRVFQQRRQNIMHAQRLQAARMQQMRVAAPAVARPVVPYRPGEVVDLLSDDDEPPRAAAPTTAATASGRPPMAPTNARPGVAAPMARSVTQPMTTPSVAPSSAVRSQTATILARAASTPTTTQPRVTGGKRILETPSPDTTATTTDPSKRRKITINGVEIKLESEPKKFGEANVGDEVVEVLGEEDEPAAEVEMTVASSTTSGKPSTTAAANDADSDFEDFQIVGGTMQVASDMPHQRYACTMHPYRVAPAEVHTHMGLQRNESAAAFAERCRMNLQHCAKCYCYVCDMVVADCTEWPVHCHATHKEAKWKQEKDARNSKILSLMTTQNRAAFFKRYKDALTTFRPPVAGSTSSSNGSHYDSDEDEYYHNNFRGMGNMGNMGNMGGLHNNNPTFGFSHTPTLSNNPKDLTNTSNLVNLIHAKLSKSKALHNNVDVSLVSGGSTHTLSASLLGASLKPSGSSSSNLNTSTNPTSNINSNGSNASSSPRSTTAAPPTAKELFLEASELLLRTLTSPRHAGDAPALVAKAFIAWFMHPLCSLELRTIVRTELTNAQARSMVLGSSMYQSLRELVSLDNATVLRLRQRTANATATTTATTAATAAATAGLPPQLMNLNEQVQGFLIPELLDLGNFTAIKQLVALRPTLVPSLLLYHIRNGHPDSSSEAVSLVYNYCATRPFSTLKPSLQEIELPALFQFLAAVLTHNVSTTTEAAQHAQPTLRQLQDSITDVLFNILFSKIYDTIKIEHAEVIGASVDAYMAREGDLVNPIRLNNVTTWIGAELQQTYNFSPLIVVLYIKYCNWRVNTAIYAVAATFSSIPPLLITPSMYANLKFPLLVVLANTFCRYFAISAVRLDTADVNSNIHMGCHIAVRALGLLTSAHRLTAFDPRIRQAWFTLPEIRKATPGEICQAQHGLPKVSYNQVSCAHNHTQFKFCPATAFTSKGANGQAVVPSWNVTTSTTHPMRVTATYCDIHYTYDTFLFTIMSPKTAPESRMAFAVWGQQLQLHELSLLVPHLVLDQPRETEHTDASLSAYIAFLVQQREILSILWKGVLRQMYTYMHAQYHIELTSLSALLASLTRVVKPFLSTNEILSASQLSSHVICRDLSPSVLTELQALDLNLRVCYQFTKFLSKMQQNSNNGGALTQSDIRHFKTSLPRFEAIVSAAELSAKLCGLYLFEYPTVSTRAIWHSFWRRYLLSVMSKRGLMGVTTVQPDTQAIENLTILLQLEDWAQVRDLVSKAAAAPRLVRLLVTALSLLPASDMTAMNYGGVSGSQVLKMELEKVLRLKYTTPILPESPLVQISEKCLETPDSALAHLVLQLPQDLLQLGALDFQPYFTYALQKKCDTARTSLTATPESIAALSACYQLVMRAYEDCVAIFHTPGRNMSISYGKVLTGLTCLRRFDLVRVLASAGYDKLLASGNSSIANNTSTSSSSSSSSTTKATTATTTTSPTAKLLLVTETLKLAHSRADFESLLEVLDPLISDAYTESSAFAAFAPVIRKFCPSSELQITTSQSSNMAESDSSRVKLLRFYHHYDAESFAAYWSTCPRTEVEKQHVLGFMRKIQTSPRFRTNVHLAVLSQLLDATAFGAYINSTEIDGAVFDKTVLFKTLLQMIPLNPYMVQSLVTAVMKILLNMTTVNESMRALLSACCTEATLPLVPPSTSDPASTANTASAVYADARTLLLYVANPTSATQVDALANVYLARTPVEKNSMCRVLFSKERPGALIKLLLRIRDYKQLFSTLKEAYYTSVLQTDVVPSVAAVAGVIDEVRQGITMSNLYNESNTSNSSISAFQKQLFDETSFTVGLGKFLLLLNEHHLDDRTAVFPEPLLSAVLALIDTVKRLVHNDAVVVSYLALHYKFTTAAALQLFNDCHACNYATIPFSPLAQAKTKPSTFCFDTLNSIARAPKFYSIALSYVTIMNILAATPTQNVLKAGAPLRSLLSSLVNSPCRYRRDTKATTALASKGLLWIPKNDSAGAVTFCATELTRMLTSFGAEFAEVLEEPILLRLWAGEVMHKADNAALAVAEGPPRLTLKDWYASYDNGLMRLVEQVKPPASYSYLLDLLGLYINFNFTTFTGHLHQALSRPYAHLYRKIVLNLMLHAITFKGLDVKVVLKVLCYEFHHPDNHFGLFLTDPELNLVMDYLHSSDDLRERTRLAIMSRDGTAQVPMASLVKVPRLLELIAKDFTKELSYDSFGALHHAQVFISMWRELASTTQAGVAFDQAAECFRAICRDFRSRTVQARLRTIFESLLPHYKLLLDMYPDRAVEIKALKTELRQIVKSKPALVKALAALN